MAMSIGEERLYPNIPVSGLKALSNVHHIPAVIEDKNQHYMCWISPVQICAFKVRKVIYSLFFLTRWKIHEACMLALGSVKTIITENVKNGRIQFDMHGFLASVILADLNLAGES